MKKSLIALAILGSVAGVAQAQSSVTLYGIADVWVGSEKAGLNAASVTKVGSGGFNGSRFGLTGSEDLGGGLKAVFKLEQGFNIDTGTQSISGTAFGRQAFVGLSGGFGTVTFGNVWSAMDDVIGAANGAFDSAFSPLYSMSGSVHNTYVDRPRNAMKYAAAFGGFSAAAVVGLDENAAVSENVVDFNLGYGAGPLGVSFAHQISNNVTDTKRTLLNGSYDLGAAKLLATVGQVKTGVNKSTDLQFGVDVPLSTALTLSGSIARTKDNAALGDGKRTGAGLAAKYALSKRTFTYAGITKVTGKTGAGVKNSENRLYALGLQHSF
ncbi:porin [Hydrogenophaga sp.]